MAKKSNFKAEDLFDSFLDEALNISLSQASTSIGIVDFAENIIFNGESQLYPPQRAILKAFYGEPLSEDELMILYDWKEGQEISRTTWVDGREYSNLVLEAGRGSGKALALDTPILTTKGWKTIETVKTGDYVFSDKGLPVKVLAESEVFTGHKVYSVEFSDGSHIVADANHQWFTWDKSARKAYSRAKNPTCHPSIKTTEQIKNSLFVKRKDDRKELNHSISLSNPLKFPERDLPIDPYILGLWLGDGNSRDVRITISIEDSKPILMKLSEMGCFFTVAQYEENCYRVTIKGLSKSFKELNLFQNKHIPLIYLYSSVSQRLELLRGLMDSDGTVSKKGGCTFYNNNYNLIEDTYQLAVSLGANATVTTKRATLYGKDCGLSYRINIRPNQLNPFFLPRKAARFKPCSQQDNKRFITDVIEVDSIPVKCIQVEGGMYLAGKALIPTHNSTLISIVCLYEFYNLISLDAPAKAYDMLPGSPLAIIAYAQSEGQVKNTLFKALKGYAEGSSYFNNLIKSKKIELLDLEIRCDAKKVSIFASHTNSKSTVGYSIKCLILDEASRFEYNESGKSKADLIWDNVGKGVTSRFGKYGKKIAISSAWELGDYIEKLYEVAEKSVITLGFRLKTWQVNLNPNASELSLKNSEDYIKDPIFSATEYEGIRSLKQGSFFISENVESAFKGFSACDAIAIPLDLTNDEGETRNYAGIQITRIQPTLTQSFAHCDYGIKKDGAALAVCSPIEVESGKWGVSVDILMLWKPYVDKDKSNRAIKRIVSFTNCEEVFLEVAKNRRVQKFSFDSYQSQATIQRLHLAGFHTCEMSTATQMQNKYFTTTKLLMDHDLLVLPKDSNWTTSAKLELQNIIQMPNGKITHSVYAKDLADAICNSVYNCYLHMIQTGKLTSNPALIAHVNSISNREGINNSAVHKLKAQSGSAVRKLRAS
jgi:hypothetical protein